MSSVECIHFNEWPVEVKRRAFRRRLTIQLKPARPITVLAGKLTSEKVIRDFLLQKQNWIEKCLEKFKQLEQKMPSRRLAAGNEVLLLGEALRIKPVITLNKKHFFAKVQNELHLHVPRDQWSANAMLEDFSNLHPLLRLFYKREAVKHLSARVQFLSAQTGLRPSSVRFREQTSRWGSCSSKAAINLNWRLIVYRPEIIDYVILHELCHIQHMNHSRQFWSLVEKHQPDYKSLVRELKEKQIQCEFLSPS